MLRNAFHGIRRDETGFTLSELVILSILLGVLAAIVAFSVRGIVDRGEMSACKAEVKAVASASSSVRSPASC